MLLQNDKVSFFIKQGTARFLFNKKIITPADFALRATAMVYPKALCAVAQPLSCV